jgi:hypothetical protein
MVDYGNARAAHPTAAAPRTNTLTPSRRLMSASCREGVKCDFLSPTSCSVFVPRLRMHARRARQRRHRLKSCCRKSRTAIARCSTTSAHQRGVRSREFASHLRPLDPFAAFGERKRSRSGSLVCRREADSLLTRSTTTRNIDRSRASTSQSE